MDGCRTENIVEANENTNIQCDRRPVLPVTPVSPVLGARGIDSSLLFFFLLLVCIVCQSDCGIEMDTLLWFFLLLVVLYNMYY
jgi:hypothetical protein